MTSEIPHLVLYSHDTFGLGHLRRNLIISQRLAQDHPRISQLLVTGSAQTHHYPLPSQLDYIKLPSIQKRANGEYGAYTLDLDLGGIMHWRARTILRAVREFAPDIVLVDKAPAGMSGELRLALEHIKREAPATRLVYGMRDIIDAPAATRAEWARDGIYSLLEDTYDTILLYGTRAFFDPVSEYGLTPRVAAKLVECGHIRRTDVMRSRQSVLEEIKPRGEVLLVVTPGGGGDGAALLQAALDMLVEASHRGGSSFHVLMIEGPLMSRADRARLRGYARLGLPLTMLEFTPDLMSYLAAADVVISMGGYNTVCEILSLRQRAIIVPRVEVRTEQLVRAERLTRRGLVQMIHPAELSPARLLAQVRRALDAPRPEPERAGIDLQGLDRISAAFGSLLNPSRQGMRPTTDRTSGARLSP